jgi:phosphatidate cytidylyltransferase
VWKDDPTPVPDEIEPAAHRSGQHRRVTGQHRRVTGEHDQVRRDVSAETEAVQREPSRITIGTDPSGMPRRPPQPTGRRRGPAPAHTTRAGQPPRSGGRDMPAAIAVGLLLAAAFMAALMFRPWAAAAMITLILGLAAVEFYDKVAEKGYRPAVFPGILTCVAAPVAAYWLGVGTLTLVIPFGFMAVAASFIGARSVEAGPMPNVSITTLGIVWIGFLGSFAILILRLSTQVVSEFPSVQALAEHRGTDTLFLVALGVVANDVGALVFGSAVGRTPLRPWISPNKTVEGFIGGAFATIIALMFVGLSGQSTTWNSNWHLLALAVVIAVMAPMGDLVESMFKRNLDVKDFGSIVKGHGGVLDRFDGFLFVLPVVYYLTLVLEPWTEYTPT